MARLVVFAILALLVGAAAVSSASSGLISQIPDWSRKAQLALVGMLCLAGWAVWFYMEGGFAYLMWLRAVPPRPAAEMRFVSAVQDAMNRWADGQPGDEAACRRATTAIETQAEPATDWAGTVYTAYRVGSGAALVVRIGRYTALRTSYNEGTNAILLEPGSAVFKQAVTLEAGVPVQFSGAIVPAASGCAFQPDVVGQATGSTFVFRFTQLRRQ